MCRPLAVPTGWGSAVYAAGVRAGQTVVIYGCGGVGANAVQGAAHAGAARVVVVDPVPFKREMAKVFGATHTFGSHEEALPFVNQATWGQLADHAIVTVGVSSSEVVNQAASIIGKTGSVNLVSVGRAEEHQIAMNGKTVRSRYRLDQVNEGYSDMLAGKNIRGVIEHPSPERNAGVSIVRDGKIVAVREYTGTQHAAQIFFPYYSCCGAVRPFCPEHRAGL
jgi:S-(hydroxymethyl)glutathione dehydrogenase/alcohol dehydrogenase